MTSHLDSLCKSQQWNE